jgi:D-alanyl-lipoteichoic acid acyltransferase DltB (MBOAT superfamily)
MLFNSYIFLFIFLPLVLLAWWLPRRTSTRLAILVIASYIFYGWFDWRFIALMLLVTISGYVAGKVIGPATDERKRKLWLAAVIVLNLGLLGYFKYAGFFMASVDDFFAAIGLTSPVPVVSVLLPLGISFYVFENLSYCIDLYRGKAEQARSFLHYMLFISIFPKLIAGPIIRYTDVESQLMSIRSRIDFKMFWIGIVFFIVGFVKKVMIADHVAAIANPMLSLPHPSFLESWIGVGAYTLQIYFDFSAYSDMAVGLGFMLGFQFPQNFNRPYLATDISDFWGRWHMTLSRWLRDYLFIPLGGSRQGVASTLRNLIIVMFLGGLWHGASWTFVLWGLYHGLLLAGYHALRALRGENPRWKLPTWPARAVTLVAVMFGWALFAIPEIGRAKEYIGGMLGLNGLGNLQPFARVAAGDAGIADPQLAEPTYQLTLLVATLVGALWVLFVPEVWDWKFDKAPRRRYAIAAAVAGTICIGAIGGFSPFIYYQF